jgi:hypothetical protein
MDKVHKPSGSETQDLVLSKNRRQFTATKILYTLTLTEIYPSGSPIMEMPSTVIICKRIDLFNGDWLHD